MKPGKTRATITRFRPSSPSNINCSRNTIGHGREIFDFDVSVLDPLLRLGHAALLLGPSTKVSRCWSARPRSTSEHTTYYNKHVTETQQLQPTAECPKTEATRFRADEWLRGLGEPRPEKRWPGPRSLWWVVVCRGLRVRCNMAWLAGQRHVTSSACEKEAPQAHGRVPRIPSPYLIQPSLAVA